MMSDLRNLWRRRQEVGAALDSGSLADDDPAWEQFPDLDEAIREARPTDPAGLAIQMRLLADEFAAIGHVADETLALRIATALEKLGEDGQHGKPDSGVGILQVASGSVAAPARLPPRRLAVIEGAGRGLRRRLAERFVSQAAALVWTINMWVIILRAGWLRRRATPAGRRAQPAHMAAMRRAQPAPLADGLPHSSRRGPSRPPQGAEVTCRSRVLALAS